MRIELMVSGGIAGLRREVVVTEAELSGGEADELRALLSALDLPTLAARSPLRGRGADRFQYDLRLVEDGEEQRVSAAEDAAPPELKALWRWLEDHRRQQGEERG